MAVMKTLSAPLSVCLGITNKCNLNCRHCLAANTSQEPDLNKTEIFNIIRQILDLKIFNVALFGGEPLMRDDFFEIVEALVKPWINLSLNTNGTLINKETAGRLSRYPIKIYTVSLDGSSPETQDPLRGKGSFVKCIEGIKNLIAKKCKVLISTTVTRYNWHDIENIAILGRKLGASKVRFNEVMYIGNAACFDKVLVMTVKEKFALLENARALRQEFGRFVTGSIIQILDIMDEIKRNQKEKFPIVVQPCGAAMSKCVIRPDGWVTPCETIWDLRAGSLREEGFYGIWHNSSVMKAFRKTFEIKGDEIPECKDCNYLRLCYKGHRCQPYYYPGRRFEHKELYCWREDVVG